MDIKQKSYIQITTYSVIKEIEILEEEQERLIRALIYNINRIKEVEKNKNGYIRKMVNSAKRIMMLAMLM